DLVSCLSNDVGQLQQTFTEDTIRFVGNVVTLLGGLAMAVYIQWRLTLIVVLLLAGTFGTFVLLGLRVRRVARETQGALADTMGTITEVLGNIRLVKAFAREPYEAERIGARL